MLCTPHNHWCGQDVCGGLQRRDEMGEESEDTIKRWEVLAGGGLSHGIVKQ